MDGVLAVLDRKLFDEPIEAWKLDPVVPSLYHEFKRFNDNPITEESVFMDENGKTSRPSIPLSEKKLLSVMEKSWGTCSPFTAFALVSQTHEPDSPWAKSYKLGCNNVIPDAETKEYFVKKIDEYIDAASQ